MNQIWRMWPGGDAAIVDEIVGICEQYPLVEAGISEKGVKADYRRSDIRWVGDQGIKNRLLEYAHQANRAAFGFDISYLADIQFTTYTEEKQGHYDWHIDTFWDSNSNYDRKLSVTVQLSDPSEYEGGCFELDPQYEQPDPEHLKMKGTVLVFPSFIRHRVTPVTKGVRKSLVAWIEGPCFR